MLSFVSACGPSWHTGNYGERRLQHSITLAWIESDSLIVEGWMNNVVAFTDWGVKVYEARDNTGKELALRSTQIVYMKGELFELEFDAPASEASSVTLDVVFTTRSGAQRIKKELKIEEPREHPRSSYQSRWSRNRWQATENHRKTKK